MTFLLQDEIKCLVEELGANVNFEYNLSVDPNGRKLSPLAAVLLSEFNASLDRKSTIIRYLIEKVLFSLFLLFLLLLIRDLKVDDK
jgi:hypothetical protein